jgi:hypothetical protein
LQLGTNDGGSKAGANAVGGYGIDKIEGLLSGDAGRGDAN